MQKQVEFYRDILGLEVGFPVKDDYTNEDWVAFKTGECTLALHSGGMGRIGDDAPKFTFEVEDVDTCREYLEKQNIRMSEKVEAYPGSFVSKGSDPENNAFFIQSHPKTGSY